MSGQTWGIRIGYRPANRDAAPLCSGGGELDFELEGPWQTGEPSGRLSLAVHRPQPRRNGLPARIADEFHLVARTDHRTLWTIPTARRPATAA